MKPNYIGEGISFWEWPVGMEIKDHTTGEYIVIRSKKDAIHIIKSLGRFVEDFTEPLDNSNTK